MGDLNYGDAPVQPEPTNLDTTNISPLPDPVLAQRANRADYALGDKSPGVQQLQDQFKSGQEPQVRQQAAADANNSFQQEKLDHIKAAASQGAPVTDKQVNDIMSLGTTPEANPDTVLEDKFAKNVVTAGVIGDPSKNLVFQSAFEEAPDRTREGVQIASGAVSRKNQAQGLLEETSTAASNVPWFHTEGDQQSKAGAMAISILSGGIAQYVNQRNLLNSEPTNSVIPGNNKLEQIQYLYLLPHDQFLPALRAAAGPGSELFKTDPNDAVDFIKAATGFSTSDAYADNVMGVANVAGILPIGTGLKMLRGVRGGNVAKAAIDLSQVSTMEDAYKAAQGVLGSSPKAPTSALGPNGMTAAMNGLDILSESSKAPEAGYYIPKSAVENPLKKFGQENPGKDIPNKPSLIDRNAVNPNLQTSVGPDGVPHVYGEHGIEIQLGRTPEEGHLPVSVETSPEKTTFRTSRGSTYEVHDNGTTTRDRAEGKGNPDSTTQADTGNGGLQKQSEKTVYMSSKDMNEIGVAHQAPDSGRRSLVQDDKGKWGVLQIDGEKAGKFVSKHVDAQDEPAKGLYPVEIWDQGDTVHFGNKITSVEKNVDKKVSFGPVIAKQEDVQARVALADIIKSQGETDAQDVLSKMGQHEAGARVGATRKLNDQASQTVHSGDVEAIRREAPSSASPQLYYNDSSVLSKERATRLAQTAEQTNATLLNARINPQRVERLTAPALEKALDIAAKQVSEKYNRNPDAILAQVNHWDPQSNLYRIETLFGKKDGTLFDTSAQAENYRNLQYKLGESASVQQEGNQFYLSHIQHADETQSGVRNSLIVSGNETPRGWWNSLMTAVTGKFAPLGSSLRSSAYTLSPFQMNNRVAATHAPSIMRNAIEDVAKDINVLGKWTNNERQEMQTILEHNRDYMSREGVRGQFYTSALEFETAFNGRFGYLPSEKQIVAYDQFTRLSDLDWTLRELDQMRDKARQGVRNYRVVFKGKDELGLPDSVKTDWFNGKLVKDFDPKITPNANVYVMPEGRFTTKYDLKKGDAVSAATQAKLKSGEYQIIQTYNPREKPLMATTGVKDDIHFVVTDKFEDKAVGFGENVPYRPGGHVIYQDQHYLKQSKIGPGTNGEMTHFGDTTIKAFGTEREANIWADKYNIVRNLIRTGDEAGLRSYVAAGNMPETLPELKRMFSDGTLSTEHPIVHTFAGRDTLQSNEALARQYPGLKEQFSAYNMSQNSSGEFLADRGTQLNTVATSGTEANPIYTNVASRLFDPYTSLQKGMAEIVRSRWMSDYKISAAESWVQEFGLLFDQSKLPIEKLRQNPVYWLYHAQGNIDAGVMKTNPELVTAAMTSKKNIQNFIGARDDVGSIMEGLKNKMINGMAGYTGEKFARKVDESILPAITNAPAYAREASFNAVLGIFNPVQLFQQAQGLAHVYALAPTHAWQSTTASALVRLYRHTEDAGILSSAADKAAAFGWNRDDFLEALDGWKRSGTHNIGGETALLSTTGDPQLFRNGLQTFLSKGQMFFKAGESVVRDTSWFTAYREWKAANPTAVLDNRALGDIGNRFQVLSLDMTRASNSALNEGVLSIPTQFWTWNARFTEQMLGNRLTLAEKARVFTMYSALYGIPATLGGVTFGLPNPMNLLPGVSGLPSANYGDIREYALANGYNVSSKGYQAISEGLPSVILNAISGHETSLQRFGPNATQLKDILDGKIDAYQTLGGASGTFIAQTMKTIAPALMYGFSAIKGDSGFPLKWNDLTNLAENISTFNNAEKAVVAWNLGKYVGKTEGLLASDVDRFESAMLSLGLNPQRVNDAYTKIDFNKHQEDLAKKASKVMVENWTLGMQAGQRGDYQTMTEYMTRNQAWSQAAGLTKAQETDIYKQAMHGNESLVDSAERKFRELNPALQNIPAYKQYIENRNGKH